MNKHFVNKSASLNGGGPLLAIILCVLLVGLIAGVIRLVAVASATCCSVLQDTLQD